MATPLNELQFVVRSNFKVKNVLNKVTDVEYTVNGAFTPDNKGVFRAFDEFKPKEYGLSNKDVIDLMRQGKIMPMDSSIGREVFPEIFTLMYRQPEGIAHSFLDTKLPAPVKAPYRDIPHKETPSDEMPKENKEFSTKAFTLGREEVVATHSVKIKHFPFEQFEGNYASYTGVIPAGAAAGADQDLDGDGKVTPAVPKPQTTPPTPPAAEPDPEE